MNEITWNDLTAGQQKTLKQMATNSGDYFSGEVKWFLEKGLIALSSNGILLTPLGKALLAQETTTGNPTPGNAAAEALAIWSELSEGERAILAAMPIHFIDGNEIDKNYLANYRQEIQSLKGKKLIRPTLTHFRRIELGDKVLSAGDAQPVTITDAGGRYRLRRWDSEIADWVDGVSQPWDVKENAIDAADDLAADGERYMVVDRLFNPVYDTTGDIVGLVSSVLTTSQPQRFRCAAAGVSATPQPAAQATKPIDLKAYYLWDTKENRPLNMGPYKTYAAAKKEKDWSAFGNEYEIVKLVPSDRAEALEAANATLTAQVAALTADGKRLNTAIDEILQHADADVGGCDEINDADSFIDLLAGRLNAIRRLALEALDTAAAATAESEAQDHA